MSFRFKQFYINDSACGMKVGTDGVLIGAWVLNSDFCKEINQDTNIDISNKDLDTKPEYLNPTNILDIGTGSGLIALMLAQRFQNAKITGIDIDSDAITQAKENAQNSPFGNRISFLETSLQNYQPNLLFDAIVSNPPYFINSLTNPDPKRKQARHSLVLSCEDILFHGNRLLRTSGTLSIIIPSDNFEHFNTLAKSINLQCKYICKVRTTENKPPKRVMATWVKTTREFTPFESQITLQEGQNRSAQYSYLTQDFYL